MRYLITGVSGQLGFDIKRELINRGVLESNILGLSSKEMDITDFATVDRTIKSFKPDVIFHCAAWTNVDGAESNVEECNKVNHLGTKNITFSAKSVNAKLVYISTDYVFDGTKEGVYEITDIPFPKNVYGASKYEGEKEVSNYPNHFIVRISWVFGINGKNFVKTMLRLAETKKELNIVNDQVGSPTYTVDLSKLLVDMSNTTNYGLYHATNEGYCSWADFAEYIFSSNEYAVKVNRINSKDYPQVAYRPKNSQLSKQALIDNDFNLLPTWQDAIDRYNIELEKERQFVLK